jgi:hypothetical protein
MLDDPSGRIEEKWIAWQKIKATHISLLAKLKSFGESTK